MTPIKVRLFGTLSIQRRDQEIEDLRGKVRELFCFLLLRRKQSHSRETLASLFWGDCETGKSKK